ncbi:MAG: transposase [Aphanocapsa feldmannii 277cV]|uniref:Transposase n=1 Tax=Aphanocapsa feldmannii 277cV TaxID=2507553 RepID=A0A524RQY7_9CHRO|nr:MAG: transposase [Aphanocapsa feldmannii 277cV]
MSGDALVGPGQIMVTTGNDENGSGRSLQTTFVEADAKAYRLLLREGWTVNHKRLQQLWHEEGLQHPPPRNQKRARLTDASLRRHRAEHPHQVWAMDVQFETTAEVFGSRGTYIAVSKR